MTPFGVQNGIRIDDSGSAAASSSGDTGTLSPGTYTFFTGTRVLGEFGVHQYGQVITKVMIRDVANGL